MATTIERRAVKCPVHGLHFDPKLTGGCIRCRREGLVPHSKPKFIPLLLSLLALTLVVAGLVSAILEDRRATRPVTEAAVFDDAAPDPRIEPDAYRDTIEQIDGALFPSTVIDLSVLGDRAAAASKQLSETLRRSGRDHVASELASFAADLGNADLDAAGLSSARERWIFLREGRFLPAPWMHDATQANADAVDSALVGAYLDYANEIDSLLGSLSPDTLTEPQWNDRLSDLEARMPEAPAYGADGSLVLGFRALQQSITAMRSAIAAPERGADQIEIANQHLASGRSHLTDLLG